LRLVKDQSSERTYLRALQPSGRRRVKYVPMILFFANAAVWAVVLTDARRHLG
jgi:hypothetical protein